MYAFLMLEPPLFDKMKRKKGGSLDRNAPISTVRFLWCLQFSLRLNIITAQEAKIMLVQKKIIKTKEGKLPKEFDPTNLNNLFVDQFVTWDEVHMKVIHRSNYVYIRIWYNDHIMKV